MQVATEVGNFCFYTKTKIFFVCNDNNKKANWIRHSKILVGLQLLIFFPLSNQITTIDYRYYRSHLNCLFSFFYGTLIIRTLFIFFVRELILICHYYNVITCSISQVQPVAKLWLLT